MYFSKWWKYNKFHLMTPHGVILFQLHEMPKTPQIMIYNKIGRGGEQQSNPGYTTAYIYIYIYIETNW